MRVLATCVLALLIGALFLLRDISCVVIKKHQCAERQIANTLDLPDFFEEKEYCSIETQEQSLCNTNCTLWDFAEESGYHDCTDLQFSSALSSYVLGTEILPNKEAYPNFIINFKDIKWNYMQYRLQVGKSKKCHKAWFDPSSEREALSISFACKLLGPWWAAGLDAELLVDVGLAPSDITAHAHYVLKVPPEDPNESISLEDWFIVVAVDISHKPNLIVHWPTVPDKYNVSEYHVRINKSGPKVVDLSFCRDGYCSCELFGGYSSRNISISVQPVHKDCIGSCYSYSPVISLETWLPLYFTLPAVLVPLVIIFILIISVYYFCCTPPREPPKVLLLFDGTTPEHYRVVREFVIYLKEFCGVKCLMGDIEIPRSESENAYKWLVKTFDDADSVLYLASPTPFLDIRYGYYPTVVYEALKLIQETRSNEANYRSDRFLVAVPPYCSEENIPLCLKNVPRFYIPTELKGLLWFLYNQRCRKAPLVWMAKAYLGTCWCPGPMSSYHLHGTQLEEKLELAKAQKKIADERGILMEKESVLSGTLLGRQTVIESIPPYPGDVQEYMLGRPDGSQVSQSDVVSMNGTDVNRMACEITEEGRQIVTESIHPYPGDVQEYMLGRPAGSQVSQSDVVSMNGTDVNRMACEITEDGGSVMIPAGHFPFPDTLTFLARLEGSLGRQDNVISNTCIDTLAL